MSTATTRPLRPANRRDLIADAAGEAFSRRGYHAVAMDDIAAAAGITAAALYRHYPNKYALFARCATSLTQGLVDALDALPDDASLDVVLGATARRTVATRASAGLYRWEARYLEKPERDALRTMFARISERVTGVVAAARTEQSLPDDEGDAALAAAGALGAIGSATTHRTSIGDRRMEALLASAARRVALAPLPAATTACAATNAGGAEADRGAGVAREPSGRREQILRAAIPLLHRDGYTNVSMGAIARSVGLAPSALYRHYSGKAEILAAACTAAAELLADAVDAELAAAGTTEAELEGLVSAYVGYFFGHTELTSVAEAEVGGLPASLQRPLRALQREHLGQWEHRLLTVRPELGRVEARVLVHAALGVVAEAGRRLHWRDSPSNRRRVRVLVLHALGV